MCATLLGGFWWVLPLVGFVMCLGFMFLAFRAARTGRACMCMGGHGGTAGDRVAQPARDVDAEASR